jgi:hypothetical protein
MLLTKLKTTTLLLAGLLVYGFAIAGPGTLPDSGELKVPSPSSPMTNFRPPQF